MVRVEVGKIFCGRDVGNLLFYRTPQLLPIGVYWPSLHLLHSLFSLLRRLPHVKRSLIGQLYDHVANMNSESAKELLKLRNSALVCRHSKRKGMLFRFSYFFWGVGKFYKFFMIVALAIPPLTVKNRPCVLIRVCALNRKNTVIHKCLKLTLKG